MQGILIGREYPTKSFKSSKSKQKRKKQANCEHSLLL